MSYDLVASPKVNWHNADNMKPPESLVVIAEVNQKMMRCYYSFKRGIWLDLADRPIEVLRWRKIIHIDGKEA